MRPRFVAVAIAVAAVLVGASLTGCSTHKTVHLITVPQVVGMSESQAKTLAKSNGLTFGYNTDDVQSTASTIPQIALDIDHQSPAAGKKVKKGTKLEVTLELSSLTVPDEVGQACTDAVSDLVAEGFSSTTSCTAGAIVSSERPTAGVVALGLSNVVLVFRVPMVVYSVTGNGGVSNVITFTKPGTVDIEQASNARLPWSARFPEPDATAIDNFESVSAQDESGTSISCTITDDGTVVDHETATGRYAIVECSNS